MASFLNHSYTLWLRKHWITALGVLSGIIGILAVFYPPPTSPRLTISKNHYITANRHQIESTIDLKINGMEFNWVETDLEIVRLKFENDGASDLSPVHFANNAPIGLEIDKGKFILVRPDEENYLGLAKQIVSGFNEDSSKIIFGPMLMPKGSFANIDLWIAFPKGEKINLESYGTLANGRTRYFPEGELALGKKRATRYLESIWSLFWPWGILTISAFLLFVMGGIQVAKWRLSKSWESQVGQIYDPSNEFHRFLRMQFVNLGPDDFWEVCSALCSKGLARKKLADLISLKQNLLEQQNITDQYGFDLKPKEISNFTSLLSATSLFEVAGYTKAPPTDSNFTIPQVKKAYKKELRRFVAVFEGHAYVEDFIDDEVA